MRGSAATHPRQASQGRRGASGCVRKGGVRENGMRLSVKMQWAVGKPGVGCKASYRVAGRRGRADTELVGHKEQGS